MHRSPPFSGRISMAYEPASHPRYRLLERIGKGGMGEVFRAYDRLTDQVVAFKRVSLPLRSEPDAAPVVAISQNPMGMAATLGFQPPGGPLRSTAFGTAAPPGVPQQSPRHTLPAHPLQLAATLAGPVLPGGAATAQPQRSSFESAASPQLLSLRLHLAQEFRTLAGLRHPHIVSVLDYGFDRAQKPFFTMELLEGARPLNEAARNQPAAVQIGLLLQVLQALTYLHRRGILHRDLKPGNILVIPGTPGPQVKLLDFGLALFARGREFPSPEIAGTVGYMAPESLLGCVASEASDLFAVGVMIHELLLGTHPLGELPTAALIRKFLGPAPIFSPDPRLGSELSLVLQRALSRDPHERYYDAAELSQALARAAHLPLPADTAEIRESFLQAATFVAREKELASLADALGEAEEKRGAVWLVGGESGVGKSRLLDELRTLALVRGIRVGRGQAVSAGGAPYQIWQGALRPLCLDIELEPLDAGVLRAVVPDIATLLDRPVPETPALDPENAQARFLWVAEKVFATQSEPLLLILEDLHWADPGSIALLARLLRSVARQPVLIVGTYRNDERPALPADLPGAHLLNLPRLAAKEIEALSASMLGESGRHQEVVSLLEKETEGNAFFIVEVVRVLVEEAGALHKIGTERLPSRIVAGGVQAVLRRRLGRVPAEARPLLCAAAVCGRELDLAVLRLLPEGVDESLEGRLTACAAVAVLEVSENRWRFAHDKLRETLLAELADAERRAWHRRIGEAIEAVYARELDPHAAALAHHFEQADDWRRALHYRARAGKHAMLGGALPEAVTHLEKAVTFLGRATVSVEEREHALGLLCLAYNGAGRPEQCSQVLEQMLADAGFPMATTPIGVVQHIVSRLAQHTVFRLRLRYAADSGAPLDPSANTELADVISTAGVAFGYARSPAQIIESTLAAVAIAERTGAPARIASAYTNLGVIFSFTPLKWLTTGYFRQSRELLSNMAEPPAGLRERLLGREAFAHISFGQWEVGREYLAAEEAYQRSVGDFSQELFALAQRIRMELARAESQSLVHTLKRVEVLASRANNAQYLCLSLGVQGLLALRCGELSRARQLLLVASEHEALARDRPVRVLCGGHSALAAVRDGDDGAARRFADLTLGYLLAETSLSSTVGVAALAETYLTLLSRASEAKEQAALHACVQKTLAILRAMSVMFPIDRPVALLWHGKYAAERRQLRRAGWLLRQAAAAAQRYCMPFDEALARQFLAVLAESRAEPAQAAAERSKARALFTAMGAHWHIAQLGD